MKSPKDRFLLDAARVKAWNQITEGSLFEQALDVATLEFSERQMLKVGQVYDAQAVAHRLQGAREFAKILAMLGVPVQEAAATGPSKLDYEDFEIPEGMIPKPATMAGSNLA